jgi:hypothetical protein
MQLSRIAPFLLLLCASQALAQDTQCTVKLSDLPDAPELFGFRMGMTTQQIKARVPQVAFGRVNEFGVSKTTINPDFDPRIDKSTFAGVRTISLEFLDGRTTSLWFGYDSSFKWQTVPEFVQRISQSLRLPAAWRPWKTRGQQLGCADFQMTVSYVAEGPSFHIVDENAGQTLAARREAKEEQTEATGGTQAENIIADRKTKIYYLAACPPANEIKQTDLVVFKSKEEAEHAGYKLGAQCRSKPE